MFLSSPSECDHLYILMRKQRTQFIVFYVNLLKVTFAVGAFLEENDC